MDTMPILRCHSIFYVDHVCLLHRGCCDSRSNKSVRIIMNIVMHLNSFLFKTVVVHKLSKFVFLTRCSWVRSYILPNLEIRITVDVNGQQCPHRRPIPPPIYSEVRACPKLWFVFPSGLLKSKTALQTCIQYMSLSVC
jgi:hypothetical protein